MAQTADLDFEILLVDDGSTDGSWPTIAGLPPSIRLCTAFAFAAISARRRRSSAGFRAAHGDSILTLDADLQDDPAEIPPLRWPRWLTGLATWSAAGSDVRHDPWHKVLPSRVFNFMVSWLTGVKLHDHNCGMKCYRARSCAKSGCTANCTAS